MKLLKILLVIVLIIVICLGILAGVGVYLVSKHVDVEKLRPQIVEALKETLGREVVIEELQISFSIQEGVWLTLKGFEIWDAPEFSSKAILRVASARAGIGILPFLQARQIFVSEIVLEQPKVNIVRNVKGELNILAFDFLKNDDDTSGPTTQKATEAQQGVNAKALAALSTLLIRDISLIDGVVRFDDQTGQVGESAVLTGIIFAVKNFSLVQPFAFSLKAAVLSEQRNFSLSGGAKIDIAKQLVYLRDVKANWDLSTVSAQRIEGLSPALTVLGITDPVKGIVSANVRVAQVDSQGVSGLIADARIQDAALSSARLKVPVKDIQASFKLQDGDAQLDGGGFSLGEGKVSLKGMIKDYAGFQDYDLILDVQKIDIASVLDQTRQDVELEGFVSAQADVQGRDLMSLALFQPVTAKGSVNIQDGQLKNINVLRMVLQRIDVIPGLFQELLRNLPSEYQDKLQQNNTPLSSVRAQARIQEKQIHLEKAIVESDAFTLEGAGSLDFSLNGSMQTKLFIAKDLSDAMIKSVQELSFLPDASGRIVFPLTISGRFPDRLSYLPDVQYIGRNLLETKGRQELQRLFDKVIGTEKTTGEATEEENLQSPSDGKKVPVEKIVDDIFGVIFR